LRLLEYRYLINAAPEANFIAAESVIAALRLRKDSNEIMAMRKAAEIAQNALLTVIPMIKIGVTERQIAAELTLQLLRKGSDSEIPFIPIVSGGPNSANPHATPSDRPLANGDLLVIDWGASFTGYYSDITRTFEIGEVNAEEQRICQYVLEANRAGRDAVCPGVTCNQVDQAARTVIEQSGYGKFFTHRTGHGLGMEGHEEPYIRSGNAFKLETGMTFTIEPGIYLPGRNGVRIEDDVLVTEQGGESLTNLPREVQRLI
jgi:Xaa-Pro dipeptidase